MHNLYQFVCMNYQNMDNMMMLYLETFKNASIVLKPERLRYVPVTVPAPTPQKPELSYATRTISKDYYSFNV